MCTKRFFINTHWLQLVHEYKSINCQKAEQQIKFTPEGSPEVLTLFRQIVRGSCSERLHIDIWRGCIDYPLEEEAIRYIPVTRFCLFSVSFFRNVIDFVVETVRLY